MWFSTYTIKIYQLLTYTLLFNKQHFYKQHQTEIGNAKKHPDVKV